MPTARFKGFFDVPVFQPAFDMVGAGTAHFNQYGFPPQYMTAQGSARTGRLKVERSRILTLNGIADFQAAGTAGANTTDGLTYVDGRLYTQCVYNTRFPSGALVINDINLFSIRANRAAGAYPIVFGDYVKENVSINRFTPRSRALKIWTTPDIMPVISNVGWLNGRSGFTTMNAVFWNYAGVYEAECFNFGLSLDTLGFTTATSGNVPFAHLSGLELLANDFDTGAGLPFYNYILSVTGFAAPDRLRLMTYTTAPFGTGRAANAGCSIETVTIDDAVLNTIAQATAFSLGQSNNGWISSWKGGFLMTLKTNGTGPTGNVCEFLVFNRDCDEYYLLRPIAQTSAAQTMLTEDKFKTFKIDEDGTVWFRSTSNANPSDQVFFSYAPALFFNPRLINFDLTSPVLPCYNTCLPGGQ